MAHRHGYVENVYKRTLIKRFWILLLQWYDTATRPSLIKAAITQLAIPPIPPFTFLALGQHTGALRGNLHTRQHTASMKYCTVRGDGYNHRDEEK